MSSITKRYTRRVSPRRFFTFLTIAAAAASQVACIETSDVDPGDDKPPVVEKPRATMSGHIYDGPVRDAEIVVTDFEGNTLDEVSSNYRGRYSLSVPADAEFPLLFSASGGTDLVTGSVPDLPLQSVALKAETGIINITPTTTLATQTAKAMSGGLNAVNLREAMAYVSANLHFGLDQTQVPDPFAIPIGNDNVAAILKTNEAMGEWLRRTKDALLTNGESVSVEDVVFSIAADLTDGIIDGRGADKADLRVAATSLTVAAQVHAETITNGLQVDHAPVRDLMDAAIGQVAPSSLLRTEDLPVTPGMLYTTRTLLAAAQSVMTATSLSAANQALSGIDAGVKPAEIRALMPAETASSLDAAITTTAQGTAAQQQTVITTYTEILAGASPDDYFPADEEPTEPDPGEEPDPRQEPEPDPIPGAFKFTSDAFTIPEDIGTFTTTVRRVDGSDGAVTVRWRTRTFDGYGTADWSTDYGTVDFTTLHFADGETSKTIGVTIHDDALMEGNETFSLLLANPTGGAELGSPAVALVTIEDNDEESTPTPPDANYPADTVLSTVPFPGVRRPGYLSSITDPTFKTRITRVTDDAVFGVSNARHHYSKVNPWNADNTRFITWPNFLVDATTNKLIGKFSAPSDYRWSNVDPDVMYGTTGTRLEKLVVSTNRRTTLTTFPYDECWFGNHEGNLSDDDKYAVISCRRGADAVLNLYNFETGSVQSSKVFPGKWSALDWATVSHLGRYVVAVWSDIGTYSYDQNFNQIAKLWSGTPHGDVAIDQAGNEVFVMLPLRMVRLDNGQATVLSSTNFGGHVSGRNTKRPGWAYISTYEPYFEVFAVKLASGGIVERFAHHHSNYNRGYEHQPQGAVNNTGTKVMFHSNWGRNNDGDSTSYPSNSYITELP